MVNWSSDHYWPIYFDRLFAGGNCVWRSHCTRNPAWADGADCLLLGLRPMRPSTLLATRDHSRNFRDRSCWLLSYRLQSERLGDYANTYSLLADMYALLAEVSGRSPENFTPPLGIADPNYFHDYTHGGTKRSCTTFRCKNRRRALHVSCDRIRNRRI